MQKVLIVGAGLSGATCARILAENGFEVELIDKNNHIGGNVYDEMQNGIIVQKYGPHIFHTNNENVYNFLKQFTKGFRFQHTVKANINGKFVPVPFNLDSLHALYPEEDANKIEEILVTEYGEGNKVPIMELRQNANPMIRDFADFVFKNVFEYYTTKQWGRTVDQLDPNIMKRVPVYISRNDKYFTDKFQYQPTNGFTVMVQNMLNHPNIKIKLGVDAKNVLKFDNNEILYNNQPICDDIIFSGAIDDLLNNKFGKLPYRTLEFKYETYDTDNYQNAPVVNYTVDQNYTRISEFKKFTTQNPNTTSTIIVKEYPLEYTNETQIPYYPIVNEDNLNKYKKYVEYIKDYPNFHLIGRLGNYKYINMDVAVNDAIELAKSIIEKTK